MNKEKISELKEYFRNTSMEIRKARQDYRNSLSDFDRNVATEESRQTYRLEDGSFIWDHPQHKDLSKKSSLLCKLRRDFREKHIAYSLARGRKREEVEKRNDKTRVFISESKVKRLFDEYKEYYNEQETIRSST